MSFQNVVGWFIIKAINDQSPVAFFSEKSRFLHMRYLKFDYSVQNKHITLVTEFVTSVTKVISMMHCNNTLYMQYGHLN